MGKILFGFGFRLEISTIEEPVGAQDNFDTPKNVATLDRAGAVQPDVQL